MSSSFGYHPSHIPPHSPRRPRPKATISTWIVAAIVLLFVILGAATGGVGGALLFLALFLFFTGLYTLIIGRPSWLRLPARKWGGATTGAAFVLFIIAAILLPAPADVPAPAVAHTTTTPAPSTATPTATATTSATPRATSKPTPTATRTSSPRPTPTPTPSPTPTPTQAPTTPPAPTPTPAPEPVVIEDAAWAGELPFSNCTQAAALGVYNIPAGTPGYGPHLDRDKDGIGCENGSIAYNPGLLPGPAPAPAPAPEPAPAPDPVPAPAVPVPAPVAPAPAPAPVPVAPAPVSGAFKNCTEARNAGAAPVYIGTPGYGPHLDRDGDGIGCE